MNLQLYRSSSLAFLLFTGVTLTSVLPAPAQEAQGCFMVNGREEFIDLSAFCPQPTPFSVNTVPQEQEPEPPPQVSEEQLTAAINDFVLIYADSYCEARAQDLTNRQSTSAAIEATSRYIVSNDLSPFQDQIITPENMVRAEQTSQFLCPELQPTGLYD